MFAATQRSSFFAVPPTSRLRWLVSLRWLALLGVAVGLGVATVARLPWVHPLPIAFALLVGVLFNLAFLRRLRFILAFPFPDLEHRRAIWQRAFPERTPLAGLDFDRIAQLSVSGGVINNIAMGAAFLAAEQRQSVSMRHIYDAACSEFEKLERSLSELDFLWEAA